MDGNAYGVLIKGRLTDLSICALNTYVSKEFITLLRFHVDYNHLVRGSFFVDIKYRLSTRINFFLYQTIKNQNFQLRTFAQPR